MYNISVVQGRLQDGVLFLQLIQGHESEGNLLSWNPTHHFTLVSLTFSACEPAVSLGNEAAEECVHCKMFLVPHHPAEKLSHKHFKCFLVNTCEK